MTPEFDTTKAHSARGYDFYLGGKDHFAADAETGRKAMQSWPAVRTAVRENRAFLGRAVRYLAAEAGIRQFLDVGAGLPSAENVHEVAQAAGRARRPQAHDRLALGRAGGGRVFPFVAGLGGAALRVDQGRRGRRGRVRYSKAGPSVRPGSSGEGRLSSEVAWYFSSYIPGTASRSSMGSPLRPR